MTHGRNQCVQKASISRHCFLFRNLQTQTSKRALGTYSNRLVRPLSHTPPSLATTSTAESKPQSSRKLDMIQWTCCGGDKECGATGFLGYGGASCQGLGCFHPRCTKCDVVSNQTTVLELDLDMDKGRSNDYSEDKAVGRKFSSKTDTRLAKDKDRDSKGTSVYKTILCLILRFRI